MEYLLIQKEIAKNVFFLSIIYSKTVHDFPIYTNFYVFDWPKYRSFNGKDINRLGGAVILPISMLLLDDWNEVLMVSVYCKSSTFYETLGKNYCPFIIVTFYMPERILYSLASVRPSVCMSVRLLAIWFPKHN